MKMNTNLFDNDDLTMITPTTEKARRGRPAKGTPKKIKPVSTEKKSRGRKATKPPVQTARKAIDKLPYWYYTDQDFVKAELLEVKRTHREIRILEGDKKDYEIKVHHEDIAGFGVFPRLFQRTTKPEVWKFQNRLTVIQEMPKDPNLASLIPAIDDGYIFNKDFTCNLIDAIYHNDRAMLTGHKGVGKTSIIEQIAARINQPCIRINMNGETRISDFLGKMTLLGDKTVYSYGVLPNAMSQGAWLICDEIDMAEPNILSLLHPVLERGGKLVLKENDGETIMPHENFRIFGTSNTIGVMQDFAGQYAGGNDQNQAFIDRWTVLFHEDHPEKLYQTILKQKVGLNNSVIKRILKLRASLNNDEMLAGANVMTMRSTLEFANKYKFYKNALKAGEIVFMNKYRAEEREVIYNLIVVHFPKR
jgi:MoxR-like ATPase